jgi:hypothetical protein
MSTRSVAGAPLVHASSSGFFPTLGTTENVSVALVMVSVVFRPSAFVSHVLMKVYALLLFSSPSRRLAGFNAVNVAARVVSHTCVVSARPGVCNSSCSDTTISMR